MQQLTKLLGWPPEGGAGPLDTRREAFASHPESVILKRVERIVGNRVDLTCMFGKEVVTFRFFASSKGMAENVAELLGRNSGRSLRDLGMLYAADIE